MWLSVLWEIHGCFLKQKPEHQTGHPSYYYKKVYTSCVRAMDYLCSLPDFDGVNAGVCGGSQGGALSIVTAALDNRVRFLSSFYPALCDMTGFDVGRAGGWPKLFSPSGASKLTVAPEVARQTMAYYPAYCLDLKLVNY